MTEKKTSRATSKISKVISSMARFIVPDQQTKTIKVALELARSEASSLVLRRMRERMRPKGFEKPWMETFVETGLRDPEVRRVYMSAIGLALFVRKRSPEAGMKQTMEIILTDFAGEDLAFHWAQIEAADPDPGADTDPDADEPGDEPGESLETRAEEPPIVASAPLVATAATAPPRRSMEDIVSNI